MSGRRKTRPAQADTAGAADELAQAERIRRADDAAATAEAVAFVASTVAARKARRKATVAPEAGADAEQPASAPAPARLALPGATLSEFDGVRYLHLGDTPWVQGGMRLRKPDAIELDYVQRMLVWLLWREATPAMHAAQLGLGAAALTRFCHGPLGLRTTAVELNPQVVAACRQWFKLPADGERLQVVVADAGDWIADPAQQGRLDVLSVDLYDHQAAAPVLDDEAFYAACAAALAPGGFFTVNLFGRKASYTRSAGRIALAFGAPQAAVLCPTSEGNTIVVARKAAAGEPGLPGVGANDEAGQALLAERARAIEATLRLPARRWLSLLRPLVGADGQIRLPAVPRKATRPRASAAGRAGTTIKP